MQLLVILLLPSLLNLFFLMLEVTISSFKTPRLYLKSPLRCLIVEKISVLFPGDCAPAVQCIPFWMKATVFACLSLKGIVQSFRMKMITCCFDFSSPLLHILMVSQLFRRLTQYHALGLYATGGPNVKYHVSHCALLI